MAMYDFTAGFSLDRKSSEGVRKDSLLDATVRGIRSLSEKDPVIPVFHMKDAYGCFSQLRENHPEGEQCLLNVVSHKSGWLVNLILLDSQSSPIKTTTKEVYGRQIRAQELGDDVTRFMNGGSSRILKAAELR